MITADRLGVILCAALVTICQVNNTPLRECADFAVPKVVVVGVGVQLHGQPLLASIDDRSLGRIKADCVQKSRRGPPRTDMSFHHAKST